MARHSDLVELIRLNTNLTNALEEIKILIGVLPVCCACGIIRDDSESEPGGGVWVKMDEYLIERAHARISHTYCPQCLLKAKESIKDGSPG